MAANKEDIQRWLNTAKEQSATHLIVMCDAYDWDDYPVYVTKDQDIHKEIAIRKGMAKLMEVYNMSLDIEKQLAEYRAYNL